MLYFAYGSCMNHLDFMKTCPTARLVSDNAELRGYRLVFNGRSMARRGGVANIRRAPGHVVHGVLWDVQDPREITALDRREGAPYVYRRRRARVYVEDRPVWAWTYELVNPLCFEVPPSGEYAGLILAAIADPGYRQNVKAHICSLWEGMRNIRERVMVGD
ncbi:gamma-glutamylcyclotransferase family protein [Alicyclobacillus macrosporangiidus]|uniref:Gamma-glutamyl cyclotransferase, AIG2-like n=1 Tax=Alicyclobacillus macrosporangiidus TaxID=392015 RepID=A0A1I7LDD9_9BACL|nr:gamma-glutamylcyclotransferase family protein [Alicyclobacillus macrosporangiidus]SFV07705.1 Gamma-glutamyl cyclotransferase, AIG2-like [Alicyclobacillus macrosporangiidus]